MIVLYEGDWLGEHQVSSEGMRKMFWLMEGGGIYFSSMFQPLVDTNLRATSISEAKKKAEKWAKDH